MLGFMASSLKRLHRDERGAEGLEKLLIIAAVALPLLGILIWFSKDLMSWVRNLWDTAKGGASTVDTTMNQGTP